MVKKKALEIIDFLNDHQDKHVTVSYYGHLSMKDVETYREELTGVVVGISERMTATNRVSRDVILRGMYGKLRTVSLGRIFDVREGR